MNVSTSPLSHTHTHTHTHTTDRDRIVWVCWREQKRKRVREKQQHQRMKDRDKHSLSHPAGRTGPLCFFTVQTHLTAACSLQQQQPHTHTHTHTHRTITLLWGSNKGKIERWNTEWEKIDRVDLITHDQLGVVDLHTSTGQYESTGLQWNSETVKQWNSESLLSMSVIQRSQSQPKSHYARTQSHICFVKGGTAVLFHRGSRIVITTLSPPYLMAHTHKHICTHKLDLSVFFLTHQLS